MSAGDCPRDLGAGAAFHDHEDVGTADGADIFVITSTVPNPS
jgi:hypothetical protein